VAAPDLPPQREGADQSRPKVGHGEEIYGVRDYREGDAARTIHWKLSARRGRLVARDFETPSVRTVVLTYPNAVRDEAALDDLEEGIVQVASVAAALLDRGYAVGLRTLDGAVAPGHDGAHREALLEHLARLKAWRLEKAGRLPALDAQGAERGVDRVLIRPSGQHAALGGAYDHVIDVPPREVPRAV
jgi:uncharacterized protein (DUF58 family)